MVDSAFQQTPKPEEPQTQTLGLVWSWGPCLEEVGIDIGKEEGLRLQGLEEKELWPGLGPDLVCTCLMKPRLSPAVRYPILHHTPKRSGESEEAERPGEGLVAS